MAPSFLVNKNLLTLHMVVTNLNEDAPLSIPEWRALVRLALRVFDDGGAGLFHDVIKIGVVKGAKFPVTTAVNRHPDSWFGAAAFHPQREFEPLIVLLRYEDKIREVSLCFLGESRDGEDSSLEVFRDLHILQISYLLVEPLDYLRYFNSPLAWDAAFAGKIERKCLHFHLDGVVVVAAEDVWLRMTLLLLLLKQKGRGC